MRKLLLLAAGVAATAMLILGPTASALAAVSHVLTVTKVGGPNVSVNAVLQSGLKAKTVLTFTQGTMSLKCTASTITSKVTANPARPGTAVESTTGETVTGCTLSPPITGVKSVSVKAIKLPYKTTVSDARGFPVTVFAPSATLKIVTTITGVGTIICNYSAKSIKGSASNLGSLVTFTKQVFNRAAGSNTIFCPTTGALTATYGPVVDLSVVNHPHVFVN